MKATYEPTEADRTRAAVEKLVRGQPMTATDFAELLAGYGNPQITQLLAREAVRTREQYYGRKVYTRGLIEFTNYCKNNCYYCGIRGANRHAVRYRLTKEEILECCQEGYGLGFRTFVLQGGEDPFYTDERMAEIIRAVKGAYPDCALTLSIGEKSRETYRLFREAGADRYLLRHETADPEHYRWLHPQPLTLENRKRCLYDLKALGYQTGAGMMVGSPGQTVETLVKDLLFLQDLDPQMVGMGPFIPHHDTCFAGEPAGSVDLTLYLLSVVRLLLPRVLLPATTALGTLDPLGREKGLAAGANVVMPNLSPRRNRKNYDLYDNKICTGEEAAEGFESLRRRIAAAGYELVMERGDYLQEKTSV